MSDTIDVSDIPPTMLLTELYANAQVQGLGILHSEAGPLSPEEAETFLANMPQYFDYLKGRVMKVEINGKSLRTALYDRDNGQGAALSCVEACRERLAA